MSKPRGYFLDSVLGRLHDVSPMQDCCCAPWKDAGPIPEDGAGCSTT
jgi:hypothetical protein